MNNFEDIEAILRESAALPDAPDELRDNVANAVAKRIRRQTLIDDAKLLSRNFGILLVVIASFWLLISNTTSKLRQLTNSGLVSTGPNAPTHRPMSRTIDQFDESRDLPF